MPMKNPLNMACRVALAGLVHDVGRFVKRAGAEDTFFEALLKAAPNGEVVPFTSWSADGEDSVYKVLIIGRHPATYLQQLLTTAARVASGRSDAAAAGAGEESCAVRLRSLFEAVSLTDQGAVSKLPRKGMPLKALTPASLFPQEPKKQASDDGAYRALWQAFENGITRTLLPEDFRCNWPLWLDAFDTGWLTYAGAIPQDATEGSDSDVSMYDHGKATAAVATALWGWHEADGHAKDESTLKDWSTPKMLLIQGDFFGIQDFIFSEGRNTNKKAAQILRGRSFYVSLLTELAALKVLQALNLPPTSQVLNAAGKFLIVAPNTVQVKTALADVRRELDAWFVKHTFATAGIGIVSTPASCGDFTDGHYPELTKRLFAELDKAKCRRFDLTNFENPVLEADYALGVCDWHSRLPADAVKGEGNEASASCALSRDQILIGRCISTFKRILVTTAEAELHKSESVSPLELPIFGFRVAFVQSEEACGVFGALARSGQLLRCWDFTLPEKDDDVMWRGYARRNINGYVPRYDEWDIQTLGADPSEGRELNRVKLFSDIAQMDSHDGKGAKALMTVKGDVDNLGLIFQKGLSTGGRLMTFAKTAALSRQMNAFFAVWLPCLCRKECPNAYTVFAGGDDFFMVGPWKETQRLVTRLAEDFKRYTAENPEVHFSVGTVITKSTVPVATLAEKAEESLSRAKSLPGKSALSLYGNEIHWQQLPELQQAEEFLKHAAEDFGVTSGYLYRLFEILEKAGRKNSPEAAMWRSRLYYSTARLFERQREAQSRDRTRDRDQFMQTLLGYLEKNEATFRIPLTNVFYSIRESR